MAKTIHVKPVETIEICLTDKTYKCMFNMLCIAYMQEILSKTDGRLNEIAPARMVSIILWSGINASGEQISMEEAEALAVQLSPSCYSDIMSTYFEAVLNDMDEKKSTEIKNMIAHQVSAAMKSITE